MRYQVRVVEDDQLPQETDWAFARVTEGTYLFIKRSRFADPNGLCSLLTAAWVAWTSLTGDPATLAA